MHIIIIMLLQTYEDENENVKDIWEKDIFLIPQGNVIFENVYEIEIFH